MLLKFCTQYVSKFGKLDSGHSTGKGPFSLQSQRRVMPNCGAGEDSWRVPWTARRSNQSILKEINPEYSLERLMLKVQYFGHLMGRADSLEKTLMLDKIEGKRRRGRQRMSWLHSIKDSMNMNLRTEEPGMLQSTLSQRIGHNLETEQQQQPAFLPRKSCGQKSLVIFSSWDRKVKVNWSCSVVFDSLRSHGL